MAITEILYMSIDPTKSLSSLVSEAGKTWSEALKLVQQSSNLQDHFWGRGHENPEMVRLHIVRPRMKDHRVFHQPHQGPTFHKLLDRIIELGSEVEIRHAELEDLDGRSAFRAPITGTALYLSTNDILTTLVWPLWTHIVRHKRGFLGIAAGKVLDYKNGDEAFLVYVGWESLEAHREYWEGEDIRSKDGILDMGNSGRVEFYHLVFEQ